MAALKKHICGFGLSLFLAACAAGGGGETWPSVSFGEDIDAIEAAIDQPGASETSPG